MHTHGLNTTILPGPDSRFIRVVSVADSDVVGALRKGMRDLRHAPRYDAPMSRALVGAWADALPEAEGKELAGLMNSLAGNDAYAYEEALPLVARRLGVAANELDSRCRTLLGLDRAMWRGLLLTPLIVGSAALSLAVAAAYVFAAF